MSEADKLWRLSVPKCFRNSRAHCDSVMRFRGCVISPRILWNRHTAILFERKTNEWTFAERELGFQHHNIVPRYFGYPRRWRYRQGPTCQMKPEISEYGLIGDLQTAGLIGKNGSLAWLCWPIFDSEACFAGLLGTDANGVWSLAPKRIQHADQQYLEGTLVLQTTFTQSARQCVKVTDFMTIDDSQPCVVRIVHGLKGNSQLKSVFLPRFDYGAGEPRVEVTRANCWSVVSGPHRLTLRTNAPLNTKNGGLAGEWSVRAGESYWFTLQYGNSYSDKSSPPIHPQRALNATTRFWRKWLSKSTYRGQYRQPVERSLITLKALTFQPSGGIVAAPTTSLPEKIGGIRNWDYRFCWLRDSTFSLQGLLECGFEEDARSWLAWLGRSIQGNPSQLKIMYGITGKREHSEWQAGWLPGYAGSRPVHIGNKASSQLQLDTYGEVIDSLYRARQRKMYPHEDQSGAALELPLLAHLEKIWDGPDEGVWEFRSGRRQFTQSKVMAWVAFDRGIRMSEEFAVKGPVERWRKIRKQIHDEVCRKGFHKKMKSFTQAYGERHLDASLLLLPIVGFLPIEDERIMGTVRAIEKHLMRGGFLLRYDTKRVVDGLPGGEGAFLACNFWLIDVYILQGRMQEARAHFEKLLGVQNDLGLLSEEYDHRDGLVGNFPQAFSHIGLINAALSLEAGTSVRLRELEANRHPRPGNSHQRRKKGRSMRPEVRVGSA